MLAEILGLEITKISEKQGFKMFRGSEKCYFEPIWERNFVNVTFLRILVMQANVITDEIAEVDILQKMTFRT